MANGEDWLTVSQAAEVSGYHPERIRELIRENKINAHKFGSVWAIYRESLQKYINKMDRVGKKRGPKHQK